MSGPIRIETLSHRRVGPAEAGHYVERQSGRQRHWTPNASSTLPGVPLRTPM